jgi:hypothetical protein
MIVASLRLLKTAFDFWRNNLIDDIVSIGDNNSFMPKEPN